MAYRFSNTDKWKDDWFINLKPLEKLMFLYLTDNCDCAGFYELSLRRMKSDLHFNEVEVKDAFKGIERAYVLSRDKHILFLKNFCKHQKNMPLNPKNNAHSGIFKKLDEYKNKFAFDLIKLINKDINIVNKSIKEKPEQAKIEGLLSPYGNGNIYNIDFFNFWSLYDKKIGNKEKCKKKWNLLKKEIQEKILSILPEWKKQFTDKTFQPYPETFLNNERWNDEIIIPQIKKLKTEFPDYYDSNLAGKLQPKDLQRYWAHMREKGLEPKKDRFGNTTDWIPKMIAL